MDWHERMQAMISSVESNLQPGREHQTPAPARRHTVVHVDRHHEAPLQHQVYELDNRVRVCFNEIADVKVSMEKNSRGHVDGIISALKDEMRKDILTVDKQTTDELRVLAHELRCRAADVEQTVKEEKRKREDHKKYLRNREDQHHEAYDQVREVTNRLATKVELLEAEVRNRNRDLTKADDDRFEDMRNEVRYQGERMEEAKRQMGLRMDKVADAVHQEVLGMTDIVRGMVKEVWKEHMTVVYSKVNESLDNFNTVLNRQVTNFKELDTYARSNQSLVEAEISKINDTLRSVQQKFVKGDREFVRYSELLDSHKAQFKILQPLPDEVSRLQLDAKRLNEAVPLLEAALRRHTVITEVVKDMPEKNEELRWELKKVNEAFVRQEDIVTDVTKRIKGAEAVVSEVRDSTANMKGAMASDQSTLNKNTKKLLNTMTKVGELEEEDGRKAAAIERLKHQIQEHQSSLRTLLPQVTNINCQVEATKHQLDPRVASTETQLQEMWGQVRELQVKISSITVPRYSDRSPGTLQVSQPSDTQWKDEASDKQSHTAPALMLSDISHTPAAETTFTSHDEKVSFKVEDITDIDVRRQEAEREAERQEAERQKAERREAERVKEFARERERVERERANKEKAREHEEQIELERILERERQIEREQVLERERLLEHGRQVEREKQLERERQAELGKQLEQKKLLEHARQLELEAKEQELECEREASEQARLAREKQLRAEQKEEEARARQEMEERQLESMQQEEQRESEIEKEQEERTRAAKEVPPPVEGRSEVLVSEFVQDFDQSSDHVPSFELGTEKDEEKHSKLSDEKVVSFEEPKDEKSTSEESTVITLSTGITSASSKRSKYSKKTSSRRSSARSSEFRLDTQLESSFPSFPPVSSNPGERLKTRPTSILQSATSGSELERPVIRSANLILDTSPENTENEAKGVPDVQTPQGAQGPLDDDDIIGSRSSKSRGKSTDKSDISLPE